MSITGVLPGARTRRRHAGIGRRGTGAAPCLACLDAAIAAGDELGLATAAAHAVRDEANERLGLAGEGYVLALIGGTGVGKSSLLNALAGRTVSPASSRRPTTARPVAWVATEYAARVAPLLERLGVTDRHLHDGDALAGVVVLDLPDVDSLVAEHREIVESLLPRVDAVAWVTDPEKYADALLHHSFLARWVPRLDRQLVVLNKADRLDARGLETVQAHLGRILGEELTGSRTARPEIVAVSAAGGPAGVAPLRAWLGEAIDAKAVVAGRLTSAMRAAIDDLARAAGVATEAGRRPLVDPAVRHRAVAAASAEVRRVVDLAGVQRQAVAATRARARPRGAGPLGRLTALAYRASGREARVADPQAYLRGWRDRGGLVRAVVPVQDAINAAVGGTPPALRGSLAAGAEVQDLARRLTAAVDRAVHAQPALEHGAPTSRLWWLFGLLATLNTALLVAAVAWIVAWVLLRPPVDTVDLSVLGRVPIPLVILAVGLVIGFLHARLLSVHAGWVGRRWARRLAATLRDAVDDAVGAEAFAGVDRVETARRALWVATRDAADACG